MTQSAIAMVWHGGADFRAQRVTLPELRAGEAIVELEAATVCGSDRHSVSGRRSAACPSVLGHEGVGRIIASSGMRAVDGTLLRPDQRVVFGVTATCGECDRCRAGLTAKCRHVLKVGHERFVDSGRGEPWSLSGTYASHIHLRAGVAAVPVSEDLPAATAATAGCAVATVMAMMEQAGRGCAGFRNGTGQ